jgi:hypothetical protein
MTLGQYITALITSLQQCDADAYSRMVEVVGERTARIQLDSQSVYIHLHDGVLTVDSAINESRSVDGEGATDSATVLRLLRGDVEVSEAILDGSLAVYGDIEQINRMFVAIEILLDAAPRCPTLQKLSDRFFAGATRPQAEPALPRANWYPFAVDAGEFVLLTRYGLLPP